jgi:hypothetical protein
MLKPSQLAHQVLARVESFSTFMRLHLFAPTLRRSRKLSIDLSSHKLLCCHIHLFLSRINVVSIHPNTFPQRLDPIFAFIHCVCFCIHIFYISPRLSISSLSRNCLPQSPAFLLFIITHFHRYSYDNLSSHLKMRHFTLPALLASSCSATRLYVSSLSSTNVTTLELTKSRAGSYCLDKIATVNDCGVHPSWLELDESTNTLYCTSESGQGNSTLASYNIEKDGSLAQKSRVATKLGGVSSTVFNNGSALAVAH